MPKTEELVAPEVPVYSAELDPGSPSWQPKKYFDMQPRVRVRNERDLADLYRDPSHKIKNTMKESINGYELPFYPGEINEMPFDFADQMVWYGHAVPVDYNDFQKAREVRNQLYNRGT